MSELVPGQTIEPGEVVVVPPNTEIVQATGVEPPEAMLWKHFATVAKTLLSTDFVPKPYQGNTPAIMACLAYGHELGLGPMQSLQSIDVIQGKPTLKPETMRALIRRANHSLKRTEATNDHVTFYGKRRDTGDEETVTFSMDDAHGLGLTSKDNWKKQPRAMLTARCTSEIARTLFSDVIMGVSYTPEEMGDDASVDSEMDSDGWNRNPVYVPGVGLAEGTVTGEPRLVQREYDPNDPDRPFTRQVEELPLGQDSPV